MEVCPTGAIRNCFTAIPVEEPAAEEEIPVEPPVAPAGKTVDPPEETGTF